MGRSLEGKVLRGEYHEAWAELAGATFANVNVTRRVVVVVVGQKFVRRLHNPKFRTGKRVIGKF